jgi:predicted peroxiredoxin
MDEKKRIIYVQTGGVENPERAYTPTLLATAAASAGIDAAIYFIINGVEILEKGVAKEVKIRDYPVLKEVIDQAVNSSVNLKVCEQSCMLLGLDKSSFEYTMDIVGPIALNDVILNAEAILTF